MVQWSPTSHCRPSSALSTKSSAASAPGRKKFTICCGHVGRKRAKWRTRATLVMASFSHDSHSRAWMRSCSLVGLELAGRAREVVEDHVGHHQGQAAMPQHRHLAVAVDRQVRGLLLHAVLEVDGAERERQAAQGQEQHRLVARAGGEAAVQHEAVGGSLVGHASILPMSDERYTVILGDRRYAIHRKWAKPKKPFGFLSDLMVDGEGRVHVAQRGTDRPVVVFDRDGREIGSWGEGTLAEPHYINAGNDGAILVADRDAHQVLRFDGTARSCRRWAGATGRSSMRRSTIRPRRPNAPTARSTCRTATAIPASTASPPDGRLLGTWGQPATGRAPSPRRMPSPSTGAAACWWPTARTTGCRCSTARATSLAEWGDFYHPMQIWIDDRGLVFVTDQIPRISLLTPDGELVGRCRGAINGAHGLSGDADGNLYLSELPPQEVTKLERLD